MLITVDNHPPALKTLLCMDPGPTGGACTRPQFHSGLHVAHGEIRSGFYAILAAWDGDRTTDRKRED